MANPRYAVGANRKTGAEITASGENGSLGTFLTGLFQNPFSALANGQFLSIIVFSIGFGLCAHRERIVS